MFAMMGLPEPSIGGFLLFLFVMGMGLKGIARVAAGPTKVAGKIAFTAFVNKMLGGK